MWTTASTTGINASSARFSVNGEDANLGQVEAGMVWHYRKYQNVQSPSDRVKYSDAELEVRGKKLGLWHDPNPVPLWEYRQEERNHRKSMELFVGKSTVRGAQ